MAASDNPVAIVCVGMAGSGKTTFMQRINSYLHSKKDIPYVMNLDPAVRNVPFESNIDIRDSVNYKEVMKQYNLGPNGGIMTSLNLFATKVDQVLALLEKRTAAPESSTATTPGGASTQPKRTSKILVDTPGQIEVFVWSASGNILLSSFASTFPTVIAYVIDTPRTASTSTFMSNMLYACSILYKTKLPMILVFNKTDVQDAEFAKEWMTDFEAFQAALRREEETGSFGGAEGSEMTMGGGSGYMGSLLNSMSLVLEEFYRHLSIVGVSAMTGEGVDKFFEAVEEKKKEFEKDYAPELEKRRKQRDEEKEQRREKELGRLMKDLSMKKASKTTKEGKLKSEDEPETISDLEDEDGSIGDADLEEEDDDDSEMEDDDEGLTSRYKQALNDSNEPNPDDFSFLRYMKTANVG